MLTQSILLHGILLAPALYELTSGSPRDRLSQTILDKVFLPWGIRSRTRMFASIQ